LTPIRLAAIAAIYLVATAAWFALGTSVAARSGEFDSRLSSEVARLWGGRHVQVAPQVWVQRPISVTEKVEEQNDQGRPVVRQVTRPDTQREPLPIDSSRVRVTLDLDHRKKGLLWYDTYAVRLRATYRVRNPDAVPRTLVATLAFPSDQVQFDGFAFRLNGRDASRSEALSKGARV
jgi:hypothetical protein